MRSRDRHMRNTIAALSIYAALLVATLAWLAFFRFSESSVDGPRHSLADATDNTDRYPASIIIPLGAGRRCRHVTFDNNTGAFQDNGVSACQDDAPGTNSTEGRMHAIRNAFTRK